MEQIGLLLDLLKTIISKSDAIILNILCLHHFVILIWIFVVWIHILLLLVFFFLYLINYIKVILIYLCYVIIICYFFSFISDYDCCL